MSFNQGKISMRRLFDWLTLTPEEFCEKYEHKVKGWDDTSGNGQYGTCVRCTKWVHKREHR